MAWNWTVSACNWTTAYNLLPPQKRSEIFDVCVCVWEESVEWEEGENADA